MRTAFVVATIFAAACHSGGGAQAPQNRAVVVAPPPAVASSDVLAYLPVDTGLVATVDTQKFLASPLGAFMPGLRTNATEEIARQCGGNPIGQLTSISAALDLVDDKPVGVMVARGVDREQLLACMRTHAKDIPAVVDADSFVVTPNSGAMVGVFVDASTVVVSSRPHETVAGVRTLIANDVPLRGSAAFVTLWAELDKQAPIAFAVNGSSEIGRRVFALAESHGRGVVGTVDLTDGVSLHGRLVMESSGDASLLSDKFQKLLGLVRSFADITVAVDNNVEVAVEVHLSPAQLDALKSMYPQPGP